MWCNRVCNGHDGGASGVYHSCERNNHENSYRVGTYFDSGGVERRLKMWCKRVCSRHDGGGSGACH